MPARAPALPGPLTATPLSEHGAPWMPEPVPATDPLLELMQKRLLLQIHDELVLEVPDGDAPAMADVVREEMERAMTLGVPLVADVGIGRDWMTAK